MLLQKKMSPHCAPSETEKNHEKHTTVHCIHWSVILRGQLYSHRSFVLLPLLSSTQLFPSNKYRTAHKQFVIGGNEFLIIETDNVLWHLEQCCSALLRARALTSLLLPPLYTNVNWVGEFPTDGCKVKLLFSFYAVLFSIIWHHKVWTFWEAHKIWKNLPHGTK